MSEKAKQPVGIWVQVPIWAQFNEAGVMVRTSEKLPKGEEFIPTMFGCSCEHPDKPMD